MQWDDRVTIKISLHVAIGACIQSVKDRVELCGVAKDVVLQPTTNYNTVERTTDNDAELDLA